MILLASSSLDSFFKLISVLLIFVFVLVLVYFTTYWLSGVQRRVTKNKNLKVIESISVGNNKFISIVEAGKKYLVVSIGKEQINLLAELERDELIDFSFEDDNERAKIPGNFQEVLNKLKKTQDK